jgi:antitoxin CcdA
MLETPDNRKKAANLSLPEGALLAARQYGLNVSAICSEALVAAVKREAARRWHEENRAAIDQYNHRIATHGTFADAVDAWEAAGLAEPSA